MTRPISLSPATRTNWLVDAVVFSSALTATLTSFYFLLYPTGRTSHNVALFGLARTTWSDLHMWSGALMIAAIAVHLALHWSWVTSTARRVWRQMRGQGGRFSPGARFNVGLDAAVALAFLLTAVSGIYFLFVPAGGYRGGRTIGWDPGFLFTRATWDLLHMWAGVALILIAALHIALHWGWICKVTRSVLRLAGGALRPSAGQRAPAANAASQLVPTVGMHNSPTNHNPGC